MNMNTPKLETILIVSIAKRAEKFFKKQGYHKTRLDIIMDITAVHYNGNPLRLCDLHDADDFNFNHDIAGIHKNLNRTTGNLENCFVPRFSK